MSNPIMFKTLAFVGGIALATAAHAQVTCDGCATTMELSSPGPASVESQIMGRLDAIEKRLDAIGEFQKTVVAPMHQQMLDGINRLEGHK